MYQQPSTIYKIPDFWSSVCSLEVRNLAILTAHQTKAEHLKKPAGERDRKKDQNVAAGSKWKQHEELGD